MSCSWWLVGLLVVAGQVPRPLTGEEVARELEAARRTILAREGTDLGELADRLVRTGDMQAAQEVRGRLPRPVAPDGPTRFVPLPEVVGPRPKVPAAAWRTQLEAIGSRTASELFALAGRAAHSQPPRYALADTCLRGALERQPDHPEARRLLGYVPHAGGWAKPFAVRQLHEGLVDHPVFGWQPSDWLPHLDRGELPAPGQKLRWLAAADADRLRAGWKPPWKILTEHFEIQTNLPLSEAIGLGRRLEAFHDLFQALMADLVGENLPLARRFRDPAFVGEPASKPHLVYYFASKDQYADYLSQRGYAAEIAEESLGFFDPSSKSSRGGRAPAYFFHDPGGQLPVTANLYHEVSHQLLFAMAGPNAYTKNVGNYWVFEGLGTYFETVEPKPDGSLEVGGLVGRRIAEAIKALVDQGRIIPLDRFVALGEDGFKRNDAGIYLRYQEAMALTVFLMEAHQGAYRAGFLDYVRDAYRGRIKRTTGRKLEDRVGQPFATLEDEFLSFLRDGRARQAEPPQPTGIGPRPSGGSIRTVPSRP
jgi:hypothetical protein